MERHPHLRRAAQIVYLLPWMKPTIRALLRFTLQKAPLSLKNKQRLYNFFAKEVSPVAPVRCSINVPTKKQRQRYHLKLELNLQDDLSRMWYYWGYAGYERETKRVFHELLKHKTVVFDVGANIGYYSLLAASMLEGRGEVHAFEPWTDVFFWLQRNAQLNGFHCLYLNQMALCDVDGEERLWLPSNWAWSNASLVRGFTEQRQSAVVPAIRFDTYCITRKVRHVDLIKIDVEGAELRVLRGMGRLLDEWLPDIILEVLEPYEHELNSFFADKPYRKFLITDNGLEEVDRLMAHPRFRNFYLSCSPLLEKTGKFVT